MPYPVLSPETVQVMVTSWVSLQEQIAAMKKDKKADKKKIAALEKELDLKGQNISKNLLADIGIAKVSGLRTWRQSRQMVRGRSGFPKSLQTGRRGYGTFPFHQ